MNIGFLGVVDSPRAGEGESGNDRIIHALNTNPPGTYSTESVLNIDRQNDDDSPTKQCPQIALSKSLEPWECMSWQGRKGRSHLKQRPLQWTKKFNISLYLVNAAQVPQ